MHTSVLDEVVDLQARRDGNQHRSPRDPSIFWRPQQAVGGQNPQEFPNFTGDRCERGAPKGRTLSPGRGVGRRQRVGRGDGCAAALGGGRLDRCHFLPAGAFTPSGHAICLSLAGGSMDTRFHYALVIGVNDYGGSAVTLRGAAADAEAFVAWLRAPTGGGVASERIRSFTPDGPTTADQAWHLLDDLCRAATAAAGNDPSRWKHSRLYIFFSGHGAADLERNNTQLIFPGDWSGTSAGRIGFDSLWNSFNVRSPFSELLVVLDCCRTPESGPGTLMTRVPLAELDVGVARKFGVFATANGEAAGEAAGPDARVIQGHLVASLMALLERAAATNRSVNAESLSRLGPAVTHRARALTGLDQLVSHQGENTTFGDFLVWSPKAPVGVVVASVQLTLRGPLIFECSARLPATTSLPAVTLAPVRASEDQPGSFTALLALEPGAVRLEIHWGDGRMDTVALDLRDDLPAVEQILQPGVGHG